MQVQKIQNNNNYNPNFGAIFHLSNYSAKQIKPVERVFKNISINSEHVLDYFEKEAVGTKNLPVTLPAKTESIADDVAEKSGQTILELANGNIYELNMPYAKFKSFLDRILEAVPDVNIQSLPRKY